MKLEDAGNGEGSANVEEELNWIPKRIGIFKPSLELPEEILHPVSSQVTEHYTLFLFLCSTHADGNSESAPPAYAHISHCKPTPPALSPNSNKAFSAAPASAKMLIGTKLVSKLRETECRAISHKLIAYQEESTA